MGNDNNNDNDNNRIERRNSRFFTAPQTVANRNAQVARVQLCANREQHIERLSRAACRVLRGRKGQLSY